MIRADRWAVGSLVVLITILVPSVVLHAVTYDSEFTGGGDGTNWSDANNWTPTIVPKGIPPYVDFNVLIGSGRNVTWRAEDVIPGGDTLAPTEIIDLTLNGTLNLRSDGSVTGGMTLKGNAVIDGTLDLLTDLGAATSTGLTVDGIATISGTIDADNASFQATTAGTSFMGGKAQLFARNGAVVAVRASSFSSQDLWRSWDPSGAYGDQTGTWYPDLMKVEGAGSQLDLSSVTTIDAGFSSGGNDHNYQQISALDGGVIDLSGVTTIIAPRSGRDWLNLIVRGATSELRLDSLQRMEGATGENRGTTRVTLSDGASVSAPVLDTMQNVTFFISGASTFSGNGTTGTFSSLGLWDSWDPSGAYGDQTGTWYPDLMKVEGAGSQLDLSSVTTIDAGFSSGGNDHNYQQISALDGGVIDLSGVTTIIIPGSGRDSLTVTATNAEIDLSSLQRAKGGAGSLNLHTKSGGRISTGRVSDTPIKTISITDENSRMDVQQGLWTGAACTFTMGDGTDLTVGGDLRIASGATFTTGVKTEIEIGGEFHFDGSEETKAAMTDAIVSFTGVGMQVLEVGGLDTNVLTHIWPNDNFAIGQLRVGTSAQMSTVHAMDMTDNSNRSTGPEALYLNPFGRDIDGDTNTDDEGLILTNGSRLVLNGVNVFAMHNGVITHLNTLIPDGQNEVAFGDGFLVKELIASAGDIDCDGVIDARDIDLHMRGVRGTSSHVTLDCNGDLLIDSADTDHLVRDILGSEYGDVNLDQVVDILDLDRMAKHWGWVGCVSWEHGDLNGDSQIDIVDLDIMAQYWGFGAADVESFSQAVAAYEVPEPTSLLLLAFGAGAIGFRRWRW